MLDVRLLKPPYGAVHFRGKRKGAKTPNNKTFWYGQGRHVRGSPGRGPSPCTDLNGSYCKSHSRRTTILALSGTKDYTSNLLRRRPPRADKREEVGYTLFQRRQQDPLTDLTNSFECGLGVRSPVERVTSNKACFTARNG